MTWQLAIAVYIAFWAGFFAGVLFYGWRDRVRERRQLQRDLWRQLHGMSSPQS